METLSTLMAIHEGNWPLDSPYKASVMQSFEVSFAVGLKSCWNNSQVAGDWDTMTSM